MQGASLLTKGGVLSSWKSSARKGHRLDRTTIELKVIRDTCLGYEVFRGSAPAKDIVEASWIDFHDPEQNPYGYQRAFDDNRSAKAREYAENAVESNKSFWPESILAVRNDADIEDDEEVQSSFQADPTSDGRFGTLKVTYTKGYTKLINGQILPWRRAFSQVDCQHRLGNMHNSSMPVTFCIFVEMSRHQEALVFRDINRNQKGIPTALVDTIIYSTDDNPPAHIAWAWNLGIDSGSSLYRLVDTGGRGQGETLINSRGLQQSLKLLIPPKYIDAGQITHDQGYEFVRNFWNIVREEWPNEFADKTAYKMMVNPGVRALSRIGRRVLELKLDVQDFSREPIEQYLRNGKPKADWSLTGPLKDATGKGSEKRVFEELDRWFGKP